MTWKPDYVTPQQVKDYLRIGDNADDAFIGTWVTAVSRNVDDFTGRQFGQATDDRIYPTFYDRTDRAWWAELDDVQTVAGLVLAAESGTAVAAANYRLFPRNALVKGKPYERVKLTAWSGGELFATGTWGWTTVPAAVDAGLYLQANRLAKRRDSPFGISGSPQEQGEIRLLAQLDPDFRTVLQPLIRSWWAA